MKTSKTIRFWSLGVGMLTAAGIVFSQVFFFGQQQAFSKAHVEQHDPTPDSNSKEGDLYISQPSFSQPVTASFVLQQELTVIQEIIFGGREPEEPRVQLTLATGKFFRALFQFIISPNAP
jgi:hypothetical protein